jgi:antitoxin component of MazEF toxin-antitoxin module
MYGEAAMIKKLSAVGNSLGLIIERPILELLDIDKDTELEVRTDGEALIIRPAKLTRKARVRASTKKMMAVHDETLRKLAK